MSKPRDDYSKALEEAYKETPDLDKVASLLSTAAKAGDQRAIYALATWYLHGKHFNKNMRMAIKLLTRAAKTNEPNALYDLAICYEKGTGVKQNLRLAMELYLKAALHGDSQSHYEVARCYYYGIGVEKNIRQGRIWMDRARELGIQD